MSGYKVILDVGMSGKEIEFPDANCWTFHNGYFDIGDGTTNSIGSFEGDRFASFRKEKVAGVIDLD